MAEPEELILTTDDIEEEGPWPSRRLDPTFPKDKSPVQRVRGMAVEVPQSEEPRLVIPKPSRPKAKKLPSRRLDPAAEERARAELFFSGEVKPSLIQPGMTVKIERDIKKLPRPRPPRLEATPQDVLSMEEDPFVIPPASPPEAGPGGFTEIKNRALRSLISTTTGIPKGIAALSGSEIALEAVQRDLKPLEDWAMSRFPKGPGGAGGLEGFLKETLPEAFGSLVPFAAGAILTRGGSLMASAYIGAATNAAQSYEEARQAGQTPEQAVAAAKVGALIGSSEAFGLGRSLPRSFLKKKLLERAFNVLEEGGQEGLSGFLNNINAKIISGYDPDRAIMEGVGTAFAAGAVLASGIQGVGVAGRGLRTAAQKRADRRFAQALPSIEGPTDQEPLPGQAPLTTGRPVGREGGVYFLPEEERSIPKLPYRFGERAEQIPISPIEQTIPLYPKTEDEYLPTIETPTSVGIGERGRGYRRPTTTVEDIPVSGEELERIRIRKARARPAEEARIAEAERAEREAEGGFVYPIDRPLPPGVSISDTLYEREAQKAEIETGREVDPITGLPLTPPPTRRPVSPPKPPKLPKPELPAPVTPSPGAAPARVQGYRQAIKTFLKRRKEKAERAEINRKNRELNSITLDPSNPFVSMLETMSLGEIKEEILNLGADPSPFGDNRTQLSKLFLKAQQDYKSDLRRDPFDEVIAQKRQEVIDKLGGDEAEAIRLLNLATEAMTSPKDGREEDYMNAIQTLDRAQLSRGELDLLRETPKEPLVQQLTKEPAFVQAARQRLRDYSTGKLAGGGQQLFDQALVLAYQIYKAGMTAGEFFDEMIRRGGDAVRPYLEQTWKYMIGLSESGEIEARGQRTVSEITGIPFSLAPSKLRKIENVANARGTPLALTPETREQFRQDADSLKNQLLSLDPSSVEFADLADLQTRLSRAFEESQGIERIQTLEDLENHLLNILWNPEEVNSFIALVVPEIRLPDIFGPKWTKPKAKPEPIASTFIPSVLPHRPGIIGVTRSAMGIVNKILLENPTIFGASSGDAAGISLDRLDSTQLAFLLTDKGHANIAEDIFRAMDAFTASGLEAKVNIAILTAEDIETTIEGVIHEAFHVGQSVAAAVTETAWGPEDLHDPSLFTHPLVVKALTDTPLSEVLEYVPEHMFNFKIHELAAYATAERPLTRKGTDPQTTLTNEETDQLLVDYLSSIAEHSGVRGLAAIAAYSEINERLERVLDQTLEKYGLPKDDDILRQVAKGTLRAGIEAEQAYKSKLETKHRARELSRPGEPRVVSEITSGPGDPTGGGKKKPPRGSPPPTPLGPIPPGGEFPELYEGLISKSFNKDVVDSVRMHLEQEALPYNPLEPVTFQMIDYIRKDIIKVPDLERALESKGVTLIDFLNELDNTISDYGYGLGVWGNMLRKFYQQMELNPKVQEASRAIIENSKMNLEELENSLRARSWWERLLGLERAAVLTQLGTAAVNVASTTFRIPIEFFAQSVAALVDTAQGRGGSEEEGFGTRLARREAQNLKPMLDMLLAMTPGKRQEVNKLLDDVTGANSWVARRLFAKYQADVDLPLKQRDSLKKLDEAVRKLRDQAKTAPPRQAQSMMNKAAEINQRRLKVEAEFNRVHSKASKAFGKVEEFYGLLNWVNWQQEFFFRGPYFLGWLETYLAREGKDLYQLRDEGRLGEIPYHVMEKALDKAMDFTFAYNPKEKGKGVGHPEMGAAAAIKFIDHLGPLGFFIESFPRWVYNAARFHYRYGPWGGFAPVMRGIRETYKSGPEKELFTEEDSERIGQAVAGTIMLGVAMAAVRSRDDDLEWWRWPIPYTGKTIDIRRFQPFASYVYITDLVNRTKEGRVIDTSWKEFIEQTTGLNTRGDAPKFIQDLFLSMREDAAATEEGDPGVGKETRKFLGQIPATFLTPLLNFRDFFAQFSEEENKKRDPSEYYWGPSVERIPYARRALPELYDPLIPGPKKISDAPALRLLGIQIEPTQTFIGKEMARLGMSITKYISRDPDPEVDRFKKKFAGELLTIYATILQSDPSYWTSSDKWKAARIEQLLSAQKNEDGEDIPSLNQAVEERALAMVPRELVRRSIGKGMKPLLRRATGISEIMKGMEKR
ncbi:MAG: hypothetical protein L0Y56_02750 [Nitrospira sp.]|nr:hypothetical protein [Nitrospira sp.]